MKITIKKATLEDLEGCLAVEKASMPNHCYLKDVWSYFHGEPGDITCAFVDDKMAGIGKFSLLYDKTAWLETLRVDPAYQGMGIGNMIYKKYFEEAEHFDCPSMAMYTGTSNTASFGLATKNGFKKTATFRGFNLTNFVAPNYVPQFKIVSPERACELILPKDREYRGYLVSNRTFYRINEATAKGFGMDGKVFEDKNGNFIVCGARFQHLLSLHVSMMGGDYSKCLDFAKRYATSHGIPKITFTFGLENTKLEKFLWDNDCVRESSDLMTMEVVLNKN